MAETIEILNNTMTLTINSTLTTSDFSSVFESNQFTCLSSYLAINAASGTSPTLDMELQVGDNNINFTPLHSYRRFDATLGTHQLRNVYIPTKYFRFSWTVGGTNPSFTTQMTCTLKPTPVALSSSMFRYSDLNLATLNSVSSTLQYVIASSINVILNRNGGLLTAAVVLQGSNDQIVWADISNPTNVTAGGTSMISLNGQAYRFYRVRTSTAVITAGTVDLYWSAING